MHHLDSSIEIDQLDVTCFFLFHYLMLNMFRMLIHPSSVACDLFVELFHGLYCSGSMCVGVTFWFGWGGAVSGCRLKQCFPCDLLVGGFHLNIFLTCVYSTVHHLYS